MIAEWSSLIKILQIDQSMNYIANLPQIAIYSIRLIIVYKFITVLY
jgi:hypothetical protein